MKSIKIICFMLASSYYVMPACHSMPVTIHIHSTNIDKPVARQEVISGRHVRVETITQFSSGSQSSQESPGAIVSSEENATCPTHCTLPCSEQAQKKSRNDINVTHNYSPTFSQNAHIETGRSTLSGTQDDEVLPPSITPPNTKPIYASVADIPSLSQWTLGSVAMLTSKLLVSGVCLGYSALLARLFYISHITLPSTKTWSFWYETRASLSDAIVSKELFAAINTRYAHVHNSAEFLNPLVYFINDIDAEAGELNCFIKIHDWLKRLRISMLFPQQIHALELATQKIQHLEYIKELLVKSVGQYTVGA